MSDKATKSLSDTMVHIETIDSEVKFFTQVLGLVEVERSDDGAILEDPTTKQRVTLVSTALGSRFSLAIATNDIQGMLDMVTRNGGVAEAPRKTESGLEYAKCKSPEGVPLMVYLAE